MRKLRYQNLCYGLYYLNKNISEIKQKAFVLSLTFFGTPGRLVASFIDSKIVDVLTKAAFRIQKFCQFTTLVKEIREWILAASYLTLFRPGFFTV